MGDLAFLMALKCILKLLKPKVNTIYPSLPNRITRLGLCAILFFLKCSISVLLPSLPLSLVPFFLIHPNMTHVFLGRGTRIREMTPQVKACITTPGHLALKPGTHTGGES